MSILALVRQHEDDVASCDKEPLGISALGNEEADGTPGTRRRLGTDGKTQRCGNGFTDASSAEASGGGREELGTGQAGNDRFADLDIDISNVVSTRSSLHLKATTTPSWPERDAGII